MGLSRVRLKGAQGNKPLRSVLKYLREAKRRVPQVRKKLPTPAPFLNRTMCPDFVTS